MLTIARATVAVCMNSYVARGAENTLTTYTAAGLQITPTITQLSDQAWTFFVVAIDGAGKIYVLSSIPASDGGILKTYNADDTPGAPTIMGLPGKLTVKLDRSNNGTSLPILAVR